MNRRYAAASTSNFIDLLVLLSAVPSGTRRAAERVETPLDLRDAEAGGLAGRPDVGGLQDLGPPAIAGPSTAAMSGLVSRKAPPAPVRIATRMSSSSLARSHASLMIARMSPDSAFRFSGRFIVTTNVWPFLSRTACGWVTYAELEAEANRLAHFLADRGVGAGDHVGIYAKNRVEHVVALLAVFEMRAVAINVNYRYVESLASGFEDAVNRSSS